MTSLPTQPQDAQPPGGTQTPQAPRSFAGAVLGFGSSIFLGCVLMGLAGIYIAAVSVANQLCPARVQALLGVSGQAVYSHPLLLVLAGLICLNLLLASALRIRLDLPRLGAHLAHGGVIVLLTGAGVWALRAQSGQAASLLVDGRWTPIQGFFLDNTYTLYAGAGNSALSATSLTGLVGRDAKKLQVDLAGMPKGVKAQVVGYLPRAQFELVTLNDAPTLVPGVQILLSDPAVGLSGGVFDISPLVEEIHHIELGDYILIYEPAGDQKLLDEIQRNPPKMPHNVLFLMKGPTLKPTLAVIGDGRVRLQPLDAHGHASVKIGSRTVSLKVLRFYEHLRRTWQASETKDEQNSTPAARVRVSYRAWSKVIDLPMEDFVTREGSVTLALDENVELRLAFSRQMQRLPARLEIQDARRELFGGTDVTRDYICSVQVQQDGQTQAARIRLNEPLHVGGYSISQGAWSTDMHTGEPERIMLGVTSRPGLPLVWAGMAMIALALPFAFYVKPWLLRRRRPAT